MTAQQVHVRGSKMALGSHAKDEETFFVSAFVSEEWKVLVVLRRRDLWTEILAGRKATRRLRWNAVRPKWLIVARRGDGRLRVMRSEFRTSATFFRKCRMLSLSSALPLCTKKHSDSSTTKQRAVIVNVALQRFILALTGSFGRQVPRRRRDAAGMAQGEPWQSAPLPARCEALDSATATARSRTISIAIQRRIASLYGSRNLVYPAQLLAPCQPYSSTGSPATLDPFSHRWRGLGWQVGLPFGQAVLQCDEAEESESAGCRYGRGGTDPQRSQRTGVATDLGVGAHVDGPRRGQRGDQARVVQRQTEGSDVEGMDEWTGRIPASV